MCCVVALLVLRYIATCRVSSAVHPSVSVDVDISGCVLKRKFRRGTHPFRDIGAAAAAPQSTHNNDSWLGALCDFGQVRHWTDDSIMVRVDEEKKYYYLFIVRRKIN